MRPVLQLCGPSPPVTIPTASCASRSPRARPHARSRSSWNACTPSDTRFTATPTNSLSLAATPTSSLRDALRLCSLADAAAPPPTSPPSSSPSGRQGVLVRLRNGKRLGWAGGHSGTAAPGRCIHRNSTAMAGNGEAKDIHSNDRAKTLLKDDALYEYMLNTMVYPREHERLRELRLITKEHTYGFMSSPPDEALLLSLLVKMMGAKNTIEVGVFTGISVLATALTIPDDGKVVAIDVSRGYFDLGLPVIEKAGVAHKVDFREGPALPMLDELLAVEGNEGKFDFAFVDADKGNYGNYHEQLLRLVRVGGVLAYDNTLWGGTVALPDDTPLTEHDREIRDSIRAFNTKIATDPRVEAVQLPVGDGITLCRRIA